MGSGFAVLVTKNKTRRRRGTEFAIRKTQMVLHAKKAVSLVPTFTRNIGEFVSFAKLNESNAISGQEKYLKCIIFLNNKRLLIEKKARQRKKQVHIGMYLYICTHAHTCIYMYTYELYINIYMSDLI